MTLAAIGVTQIGNLFAQRTEQTSIFRVRLGSNPWVWAGIATELMLLGFLLYTPFLQRIFDMAPFPLWNWLFLFAWTPILLIADEGRKALVRHRDRRKLPGSVRAQA
jgi:magnesium-transporting ATPase (P-type)